MDRRAIIKDMRDIVATFKSFNVPIYLSYGALLGAVREKDFIEWDDDVDFDVVAKIDYKTRKLIGHRLLDLGFKTQGIWFGVFDRMEMAEDGYNGDERTGIIVCERNFKFSIFFYGDNGDDYLCIPRPFAVPLLNVPKKFFEKTSEVRLHGQTFECPAPTKDYLTWVYGDWKKPVKGKHAPQWEERNAK